MKKLFTLAYNQGVAAAKNGYERTSCPYHNVLAEKYWLDGFDSV